MYTSKTLQRLSLITILAVVSSCNSNKPVSPSENLTNGDTLLVVTGDANPTITDTITVTTPTNETTKQIEPPIEKPAIKFDLSGKGTIVQKGEIWVIRTTGTGGTDYVPSNLDDKFKVDGKIVTFEANLLPIPKGVRMAGNPITLVSIK